MCAVKSSKEEKAKRKRAFDRIRAAYRAGELTSEQVERAKALGAKLEEKHVLQQGVNDLATERPELAREWDFAKNNGLKPSDVMCGSGKRVWWRHQMPDGTWHEWGATVYSRAQVGSGCPFCRNKKVLPGFNDLATLRPDLAAEWHPTLNKGLKPGEVVAGSGKKVWWLCSRCGYEWKATVASRTGGTGCKRCAGKVAKRGVDDLATLRPDLAAEWHPTLNENLKPDDVTPGSNRKVWWRHQISDGSWHEWSQKVCDRSLKGRGCPYCSGQRVLTGFNDLKTKYPDVAAEWDYELNYPLKPEQVYYSAKKEFSWICGSCGYKWSATLRDRTSRGFGCPACSGKRAFPGRTDLASRYPEVAAKWHPTLNDGLTPKDVLPGSRRKAWWECPVCRHAFKRAIDECARYGVLCPECTKAKRMRSIRKPVVCVETGELFDSIRAAQKAIGIAHAGISRAVKTGGTSGGYHWRWADNENTVNKPN